ncbi:D-amino-acid transaminase [Rhodomicrobium lacus]|uniref:D-amino-acid transaminase n=1 Tax=Rhodomicrobium lacus TaxID=2498452 RepID=UPI0026E491BC|nr:D-amino-acid transaminase [Rhodomicrobium lacus]WKW51450.1 D-amino-acid transaminase [Rhodomicrobium lacus]
MTRVVYVNGEYVPYAQASVHVEDRGFQFADGVYEVCEILDGDLVDERRHLARLQRSLSELQIDEPMSLRSLGVILRETVRRNRVRNGIVYLQITRGVARRDFAFPSPGDAPGVVCFARSLSRKAGDAKAAVGVAVITLPDIRWKRVDIKTTGLLAQSLARQAAREAGAYEAWLVDEKGYVTEGASCNAWIVTADGKLVTRSAESGILRGITREVAMETARARGLQYEERPFTVEEAKSASEAFQTSASGLVMPVVKIDGVAIGTGKPGEIASGLRTAYHGVAEVSRPHQLLT